MRYLLNLTYDGSEFFGSQKQKDKKTILGELEKCISKIFNEEIKVVGCSRTDRGVHALDYYAHFDSDKEKDNGILKYSINKMIDESIFIKSVSKVSNEFHSRFSVKEKEYVYQIYTGEYNPILRNYYLEYNKSINIKLIKKACKELCGVHDYKAFTSDSEEQNTIRCIKYIKIKEEKEFIYIYIASSGFLKYMVRNIVGLLLSISENKKDISIIEKLYNDKDRRDNAKMIKASGLYLNKVSYK